MQQHFITFDNVCKYYQMGSNRIAAADHVSFFVDQGEFCVIVGPSGAGKTTVLNMLGGMDSCDEGHILLDGNVVSDYTQRQLTTYRRYDVGFVFQFYNLVQNLTALENVELASEICRDPLPAEEMLQHVGLAERMGNFPAQLSGGEQQRVSIARALANRPPVILADEPTAPLDSERALGVMRLLNQMAQQAQTAIIVVTHDEKIIPTFRRIYHIRDGQTVEEAGEGRSLD